MATLLTHCRVCGASTLEPVLSLGQMPKVNSFLASLEEARAEQRFPLAIVHCPRCTHVQLTHMLEPSELFSDYIYFSSMSASIVRWGQTLAERYARELSLRPPDLVVELASNDGCVLKPFSAHARILGVEPARNVAEVAIREGVPTRVAFFSGALGAELAREEGRARLILARNVVAHVPELVDFLRGASALLADDGVFHIEVPYLGDMLEGLEFDTIYHEHLSYFSATALDWALREAGLVLWDVERIALHGGSLAARARRSGAPTAAVTSLLEAERRGSVGRAPLERFAKGTAAVRRELPAFLDRLKAGGARIGAYGAAAKGVVLTNACGIGTDRVEFVADRSPYKQGKWMPGMHLPVVSPQHAIDSGASHLLVLAWNFFEEIRGQLEPYERAGGRFLLPIPEPREAPPRSRA